MNPFLTRRTADITTHDALKLANRVDELEASEAEYLARIARLQDAFKIACMIADDRRTPKPHTQYAPNMMGEDSLFEVGLQPDGLDPITN